MTRSGYIALALIMSASLIGLIICSVKQRREAKPNPGPSLRDPGLPTVMAEPLRFRCGDFRIVTCKASGDFRNADPRYMRKELAYLLADQLIDQGAIRYTQSGTAMRAELRAVLPEVSGT
jgi:hypothetical protein